MIFPAHPNCFSRNCATRTTLWMALGLSNRYCFLSGARNPVRSSAQDPFPHGCVREVMQEPVKAVLYLRRVFDFLRPSTIFSR